MTGQVWWRSLVRENIHRDILKYVKRSYVSDKDGIIVTLIFREKKQEKSRCKFSFHFFLFSPNIPFSVLILHFYQMERADVFFLNWSFSKDNLCSDELTFTSQIITCFLWWNSSFYNVCVVLFQFKETAQADKIRHGYSKSKRIKQFRFVPKRLGRFYSNKSRNS